VIYEGQSKISIPPGEAVPLIASVNPREKSRRGREGKSLYSTQAADLSVTTDTIMHTAG
jgi:hypothetical protein